MTFGFSRIFWASLIACTVISAQAQGLRLPGAAAAATTDDAGAQRASDYIVAIVNTEPITNQQVRQEMQRLGQQLTQQQVPVPPVGALAQQALDRLITERSQIQFALETGIKIEDFALDDAEKTVARQNQIELDEMHRRLEAEGISRSQFRKSLRDQMLLSRVRDREIGQRVKVSELDIDQYLLDPQREASGALAEVNIAHILLELPEGASAAQVASTRAQAEQIMARVRAGEDFPALARTLSKAPDAADGGLFGMRALDRYPKLFTDAVRTLEPGAMTIVRSGAGLHILRLIDRRYAGGPATTVVQARVSHILLRPTAAMSEQAAIARLQDFRQQILAGKASFEALAKEYSQDGSAAQGGDLGWSTPGRFVPEFDAAVETLQPGEIAPPLVSRFGVHLIQLIDRKRTELSVRDQREAVRAMLREKKLDEAYISWSSELRARAYVDLRDPPS